MIYKGAYFCRQTLVEVWNGNIVYVPLIEIERYYCEQGEKERERACLCA